MNVLFYIPVTSEASERIQGVVEMLASKANTEVFQSIEDLSHRLRQPANSSSIVTLLVRNKEDLIDMVSIRHLLSEIAVILILPYREESTTAMGYTLCPRFLTYVDSNFMEVGAVLGKMLENYKKKGFK